jgi:hypothetical protein
MRDWQELVDRHLAELALRPADRADVIAELAAHLEELCEELRSQGMTEEDARRQTMSLIEDWDELRRRIQSSRKKESPMNQRVKQLWFPGFLTLLLAMGLLALVQLFGPIVGAKPWTLARNTNGWNLVAPVAVIYLPWLFSLPLVGAIGAYLSTRAGATPCVVFTSTVSPILTYFGFFAMGFVTALLVDELVVHNIMFSAVFVGLLAWVLAPAAALLVGVLIARHFVSRSSSSSQISSR